MLSTFAFCAFFGLVILLTVTPVDILAATWPQGDSQSQQWLPGDDPDLDVLSHTPPPYIEKGGDSC